MIELINTDGKTGSQTWLIRHTDENGETLHKPQRYTVAPGTPREEIEAFAGMVLENHKAGRPLTYQKPTEAEKLQEAKAKKRSEIESEAQRRIDAIAPPNRRERLQVIGIKIAHSRGRGKPVNERKESQLVAMAEAVEAIDDAEQAALEQVASAQSIDDADAVSPAWPELKRV